MTGVSADRVRAMLETMARLQDDHNCKVASDWRDRGFPYARAVWVECAELLDHFGWKWWKQQHPDLGQVRLEVVDIWHFGLSMLLLEGEVDAGTVKLFQTRVGQPRSLDAFRSDVEALAVAALADQRFDIAAFIDLLNGLDMDLADLTREYIGKNVLNNFRQAHGYQDGSYRKVWGGREDNVHLLEVIEALDAGAPEFADRLWDALVARYRSTATA